MKSTKRITDDQIRELQAYANRIGDTRLEIACKSALAPAMGRKAMRDVMRDRCASAYETAVGTEAWNAANARKAKS